MKTNRILSHFFILLLCLASVSCNTFRTYYGTTYQQIDTDNKKHTFRLDLSEQNLIELPEEVIALKELRMINLSGNAHLDLEKAFETLSSLLKLEVILLDSMEISGLPDNFRKLEHLNHVSLVNNPSLNFAQTFELMRDLNLEFLNLSQNNLKNLPVEINQIKRLQDLKLSNNQLKLPDLFLTLSNIPMLRSLWLDNNKISQIPPEITFLDQIVYLYIDENGFTVLPKEMSNMNKLMVLHAAGNNLGELPVVLIEMPHIKFAIMSNNPIESIPTVFNRRDYSLLALVMDGNKLDETEKELAVKMFRRFFIFSAR
jgi:Leucine-rich repeat (LRR) protein